MGGELKRFVDIGGIRNKHHWLTCRRDGRIGRPCMAVVGQK